MIQVQINPSAPLVRVHSEDESAGGATIHVNDAGLRNLRDALNTAAETGDNISITVYENGQWKTLAIKHATHEQFARVPDDCFANA